MDASTTVAPAADNDAGNCRNADRSRIGELSSIAEMAAAYEALTLLIDVAYGILAQPKCHIGPPDGPNNGAGELIGSIVAMLLSDRDALANRLRRAFPLRDRDIERKAFTLLKHDIETGAELCEIAEKLGQAASASSSERGGPFPQAIECSDALRDAELHLDCVFAAIGRLPESEADPLLAVLNTANWKVKDAREAIDRHIVEMGA